MEGCIVVVRAKYNVYPHRWIIHNFLRGITILTQPIEVITLRRPSFGRLKMYVDASFSLDCQIAGGGVVIVDHMGRVTLLCTVVNAFSSFEAEAKVFLAAATYVLRRNMGQIDFISDCKDVVEAIEGHSFIQDFGKSFCW